jgi:hypothetical protein
MECKNCNQSLHIVNKHFKLCADCNNMRLHGSKFGKQYNSTKVERKPLRTNVRRLKSDSNRMNHVIVGAKPKTTKQKISEDEAFYEQCFNLSDHQCEECGCNLPTDFRDEDGRVTARWRYSHIIPKSIAPNLRHDINNINHLCITDHQEWENGDRESMKIYKNNKKAFPNFFKD